MSTKHGRNGAKQAAALIHEVAVNGISGLQLPLFTLSAWQAARGSRTRTLIHY